MIIQSKQSAAKLFNWCSFWTEAVTLKHFPLQSPLCNQLSLQTSSAIAAQLQATWMKTKERIRQTFPIELTSILHRRRNLCGDTASCSVLISPRRLRSQSAESSRAPQKHPRCFSYVDVDRSEGEDLGAGVFLGGVPVELVSPPVPLDGVKGWILQIEGAGQGCLVAFPHDAGLYSQFDVLQTVKHWNSRYPITKQA